MVLFDGVGRLFAGGLLGSVLGVIIPGVPLAWVIALCNEAFHLNRCPDVAWLGIVAGIFLGAVLGVSYVNWIDGPPKGA